MDDESTVLGFCQGDSKAWRMTHYLPAAEQEAGNLLQNKKAAIGLALLDALMAHMNGIELADRILAFQPSAKIVFMSGPGPKDITFGYGYAPSPDCLETFQDRVSASRA